jgi:hypothetical protein
MKYEYKTVVTKTMKDIVNAEKLKAQGWKIINASMFAIMFERIVKS